jgi:hypothetical protein
MGRPLSPAGVSIRCRTSPAGVHEPFAFLRSLEIKWGRMAIFYRGAGVGTWWHTSDARLAGFTPHSPGASFTSDALINHIACATITSPFVSLTKSYGVAKDYALNASRIAPDSKNPAYVYKIEIDDALKYPSMTLIDPIKAVAQNLPDPCDKIMYQHDGVPRFLLGVIDPKGPNATHLTTLVEQPPGGAGTPRAANLTPQLEALIRALRDAEILACGTVPKQCIIERFDIY